MWFDPTCEEPALRRTHPDSELLEDFYEGGALDGTLREEEGVTRSGLEANRSASEVDDLPF